MRENSIQNIRNILLVEKFQTFKVVKNNHSATVMVALFQFTSLLSSAFCVCITG